MKNSIIEKSANKFRNECGLSSSESINLSSLLLKLNVSILFKPLSNKFSGMAIKCDDSRFVLINSSQNLGRQNFTICHELYHLFIQENFIAETTYNVGSFDKFDVNERNADFFASYFLMPVEGILSLIPDEEIKNRNSIISLDTVIKLEQFFKVSRSAMLYRLRGLGYINKKIYDEYANGVLRSVRRRGISDSLYTSKKQEEFQSNYGDLANHLVETEKISEGDYYSLMMDIGIDLLSNVNEKDQDYA